VPTLWFHTRRSFLEVVLGGLFSGATRPLSAATISQRVSYRVNATVVVACLPVFSKQNVGGASVAVEKTVVDAHTTTRLEFAAGTWPERLEGINRFGVTRETVQEESATLVESSYVSFMASSREKTFSDAREALRNTPASQALTVARGRSTAAGCAFRIENCTAPENSSWRNCLDLANSFEGLPLPQIEPLAGYSAGTLPTFLFTVWRAIRSDAAETTALYTHNGNVYRLRTRSQVDSHSNELALTCSISGQTEFKLWLSSRDRTALPRKIEFRPRSFLKLTLEQEQT
jgi:hypothetical protein